MKKEKQTLEEASEELREGLQVLFKVIKKTYFFKQLIKLSQWISKTKKGRIIFYCISIGLLILINIIGILTS